MSDQAVSAGRTRRPAPSVIPSRWMDFLFAPRPLPLLLAVSAAVGVVHVLTIFSWRFVLGTAGFWAFPRGTVPGGTVDMTQELVGYLYLVQGPWDLPLLHVPNLLAPAGSNAFWLDPVPWLALVGRVVRMATGQTVNLFGVYAFFAFALPGAAMTWLLALAGQRGLVGAVGAALITDATPFLLFEWGHVALCGQVLTIVALALYLLARQHPADRRVKAAWLFLLALAFLTHMYLFVMVGGIWTAGVAQRAWDGRVSRRGLWGEVVLAVGLIVALALLTGILSRQDRSGGTMDFGIFSMNLGSPVIPQLSGVIPPLRHYWIGMHSQVLAYVGLGALLVLLVAAPGMLRWLRAGGARRHGALIAVMTGFYLFALSTTVTLGAHVLLHIRLPHGLAYALGAFRASGRFFWPVGYAAMALGILTVLRTLSSPAVLALLALAGLLQVADVGPIRRAVAASARHAVPEALDRAAVGRVLDRARAVMVFPSYGCVGASPDTQGMSIRKLAEANVEVQLLAARRNLPINSMVNSRISIDCIAEARAEAAPLRRRVAYVYLIPGSGEPRPGADGCRTIDWLRVCLPDGTEVGAGT